MDLIGKREMLPAMICPTQAVGRKAGASLLPDWLLAGLAIVFSFGSMDSHLSIISPHALVYAKMISIKSVVYVWYCRRTGTNGMG